MFEVVKLFLEQFFAFLPELTIYCIVLSIVGSLTFRR